MAYIRDYLETPTPQNEALDDRQVQNSAGGYVYPVTDATRMARFLVLGSENGSFYADERKLTKENTQAVARHIRDNPQEAVQLIVDVSEGRRAPRNSEALYCLALAASHGHDAEVQKREATKETRRLAFSALPRVARTGSHLMEFIYYCMTMRGWGRGLRTAISDWYTGRRLKNLVLQMVKYRSRNDWTHRDLLRVSHPFQHNSRALNEVFAWVTHGTMPSDYPDFDLIRAYEAAQKAETADEVVELIHEYELPREAVPTTMMSEPKVWEALGHYMPPVALVRNLANLTRYGAIAPMKAGWVCDRIREMSSGDEDSGPGDVHPISILTAMLTYRMGHPPKMPGRPASTRTWTPVQPVLDALDDAFDRSFAGAPRTNKRLYLGIDVSGSMGWSNMRGIQGLTPRMGAAALAMAVARREPNYHIAAFAAGSRNPYNMGGSLMGSRIGRGMGHTQNAKMDDLIDAAEMMPLDISARDSIQDVMAKTEHLPAQGTDCALPILDAMKKQIPVDCFIVLTDIETWTGAAHPAAALQEYRKRMGIPAKFIVMAMVSNGFTIADPDDAGMLDLVGFDAAMPALIADFVGQG